MPDSSRKKSKGPDFRVYVGTSFHNTIFCEIEALAKEHGLAAAQVVRELFLRGLAAYHRDGRLNETRTPAQTLIIHEQNESVEIAA
jgi:hypothetical protein